MHPYANPILYVPVEFPDQEQDGDDLFKQAVLSTETDVALQEEIETLSKRTDHQSAGSWRRHTDLPEKQSGRAFACRGTC